jgi:hypothetical protein
MPTWVVNGSSPFELNKDQSRHLSEFIASYRRMQAEHAAMAEYLERTCIVFRKKKGGPLWWDEHQTLVRDGARA